MSRKALTAEQAESLYGLHPHARRPLQRAGRDHVAAVLGTTFTGHKDDIIGIDKLLRDLRGEKGLDVPLHVDAASGGFAWPFLYPDSEWDFRLIFRERSDLAEDLVFYENYLGKTDATFTLNFSTGAAMVLAQYYNLVRFGRKGYGYVMETMQKNAEALA